MSENPDEAFANAVNQMGAATLEHIEIAKAARSDAKAKGASESLADVMIRLGMLTPVMRESIEKRLQVQAFGGIKQLAHYKLRKKLGEGGMGTVYLADDVNVGRPVALKVLSKKYASNTEFLSRFRQEARSTGHLNHPNIVTAFDFGEDMGNHYYTMEYCEGESLDAMLKREKFVMPDLALEYTYQAAGGLQHAHEKGFVHRDIKPGNLLVATNGLLKILDLGLAKDITPTQANYSTQTGVTMGTPYYISPEQACGQRNIDGRCDIYSLGATLFHLVTGQFPFDGDSSAVIMTKHLNEKVPNPQSIRKDIPDGLVSVIYKMMKKAPQDRYANCAELRSDLEQLQNGERPSIAESAQPRRLENKAGKRSSPELRPAAVRAIRMKKRAANPWFSFVALVTLTALILVLIDGKFNPPKPAHRESAADPHVGKTVVLGGDEPAEKPAAPEDPHKSSVLVGKLPAGISSPDDTGFQPQHPVKSINADFKKLLDDLAEKIARKPQAEPAKAELDAALKEAKAKMDGNPGLYERHMDRWFELAYDLKHNPERDIFGLDPVGYEPSTLTYTFTKPEQFKAWEYKGDVPSSESTGMTRNEALHAIVINAVGEHRFDFKSGKLAPSATLPFCFNATPWSFEANAVMLKPNAKDKHDLTRYGILISDGKSVIHAFVNQARNTPTTFHGGIDDEDVDSPAYTGNPNEPAGFRMDYRGDGYIYLSITNANKPAVSRARLKFEPTYIGMYVETGKDGSATVAFSNVKLAGNVSPAKIRAIYDKNRLDALRAFKAQDSKSTVLQPTTPRK